ncbi:MAG: hypothetical protein ACR2NN_22890 [Bryobacteraceae bacterium]
MIEVVDYHWSAALTYLTVITPPVGSVSPRQIGVRPTGSYWGSAGEQIDMRSGNLNFTQPLVKAQGRGGWGVGFHLSYNSQNWMSDGNIWQEGRDVGYGFGWRLQAGSLRAVYQGWYSIHHYVFTDSTGAEYRLDLNSNGVWSSKESLYVWYDSNTQRLYFNDGSFWVFGATAAGTQQDAGTSYRP